MLEFIVETETVTGPSCDWRKAPQNTGSIMHKINGYHQAKPILVPENKTKQNKERNQKSGCNRLGNSSLLQFDQIE